jgi:signal transduction histidine kinase
MYSLFQFRVRQLLALEELRTEISSDLHDNLGSLLSGLAMQSELLEVNAKEENKSKLNKIARTSRDAISQMRDLVWSIDNRRERTSDLLERMEEVAEELLLPKNISFHIEKNDLNLTKKLSITAKQHVFFIYKEAITNILRHANAKNVWIKFSNQNGFGQMVIKDDGTIKQISKSTGFGLVNMKRRAQKMNATIDFTKEKGFEIHLKLPFKL